MKYLKNTKIQLVLILFLAAILRLPFLGNYPPGITIDEAGQGYSAYSILKTGKDEWGDFLPLNPRGFGDYKPPVFMYLLVPSIAVFGLSEFAVRLPSAIAGILIVWVVFFLVRDLFNSKKLALISSFLTAITPCLVYYSRLGWESNVGLLFSCLGIWLFLKGLKKNLFLSLSALSLGLSALSYHSFKLLSPLIILGLIIIFRKQLKSLNLSNLIKPAAVLLVFILILGYGFIFSGAGRRASDQSILKEENLSQLRQNQYEDKLPQPLNRILNNKYQFLISKIADNYIGYFSFSFLFGPHRSDGSVLNFPEKGLLYIWQLPLILLGLFYLFKNFNNGSKLIFFWLLIVPIPASLTQDYMHAGRAQALFPALVIISAAGLVYLLEVIKKGPLKLFAILSFSLLIFISLILRIDNYVFHTFNRPHGGLIQGYSEIINFTEKNKDKYSKIIFTKSNSEPQAFIAFYSKMDPQDFQKQSQNWKSFEEKGLRFLDMSDYSLGKYDFTNVDYYRDRNEKNALLIGTEKEIPPDIKLKFEVKDLTGKNIFKAADTNEIQ